MFLLLPKRRICSTIVPLFNSPRQIHPLLPHHLFSSESTTQSSDPKTPKFVVVDYLVASFGFSSDKATRVSKRIAHLNSPEKPDSVRCFLKDKGFSEADISKLITWRPDLLGSSPQNTLDPNFRSLQDMGLSTSALNKIILSNPTALLRSSAVSRITFWMDFLGGNESAVVKAFTRNRGLISLDINSNIAPKISLLQSHGFSNQNIGRIVSTIPKLITSRSSGVEDVLKRTEELGFQPGSGMFLTGLHAMTSVTRAAFKKKMDLFKSFGWSEHDFFSAVRSAPLMVPLNEEKLRIKMDFLLGEAKCAPSYIVSRPILLTYSLEKRLRPRNNVLHLLETKGLAVKKQSFQSAIQHTDKQFVHKYILPHKEEIPELYEAYLVACA